MTAPLTVVPTAAPTPSSDTARIRAVFQKQQARRWQLVDEGPKERRARLLKLKAAILERREAIKEAIYKDFKKPYAETENTELLVTLMELHDAIKNVGKWMKPEKVKTPILFSGTRSHVRREPKGVVLVLGPFNYPFQLILGPLVGALAAGNCVMVKPSEKTPHTSRVIAELLQATFDESEVAVFEGGTDVAQALLDLPFDHMFFTGGSKVGRIVMQAAAKHLASVTLELGGKSPAVVDASADVRTTADRLVWGKFVNAGQTCIAPDYVLVHESREQELLEAMKGSLERFYGKDEEARKASPDFARLVDDAAYKRLAAMLERTRAAGARVVAGGVTDAADRYIAPTVLAGVTHEMPVMEEEIFGPLLPVLTFKTLEDVFTQVRSRGKPLALYVFARDEAVVKRVIAGTSAGGSIVNNTLLHCAQGTLPFGGTGESGIGNYHGEWGFKTFSHERAVMRQGRAALANLFFPPYTKQKMKMARMSARMFE